jgi:hypothetical protein
MSTPCSSPCNKPSCNCTVSLTDVLATGNLTGLCVPVNAGDTLVTILNRICQKISVPGSGQVQSDWNTINPAHPSFIKNKPHIMTPQEISNLVNQIISSAVIDWSQIVGVPNFLTESNFLSLLENYLQTHGYLTEGDLITFLTTHGYLTNEEFLNLLQQYLNSEDFKNLLTQLLNSYFNNFPLVELDPTVAPFIKNIVPGTLTTQFAKWNGSTYAPHILTFSDITGTINQNQYNQSDIDNFISDYLDTHQQTVFDVINQYFTTIGTTNVPIATTSSLGVVQVGSGLQITTGGILSVTPETTVTSTPCGVDLQYKGGASYPTAITVQLGSGTGTVKLKYNAYNAPDKFVLMYDGVAVIDTGYRGSKSYQTKLNNALAAKGAPPETIQGAGLGEASFNKTSAPTQLPC